MAQLPKNYAGLLELVNAMITTRNLTELTMISMFGLEGPWTLSRAERQYLLQKVDSASSEYQKEMERGRRFVWNLPRAARTSKTYRYTVRYIKYTHDYSRKAACMKKLYLFLQHDNGVGTYISKSWAQDLLAEIFFTFPFGKNIMEMKENHVPWNAFVKGKKDCKNVVWPKTID